MNNDKTHNLNNNIYDMHKIIEFSNKPMDNKNSSKNDENFNNKIFYQTMTKKLQNLKIPTHPLIKLPITYLFH